MVVAAPGRSRLSRRGARPGGGRELHAPQLGAARHHRRRRAGGRRPAWAGDPVARWLVARLVGGRRRHLAPPVAGSGGASAPRRHHAGRGDGAPGPRRRAVPPELGGGVRPGGPRRRGGRRRARERLTRTGRSGVRHPSVQPARAGRRSRPSPSRERSCRSRVVRRWCCRSSRRASRSVPPLSIRWCPPSIGDAVAAWPDGGARCSAGRASAAFLFPLPHTATVRVLLPLVSLRPGAGRRRADGPPSDPEQAPDWARVVSGWEAQIRRAPRLEAPEHRLDEAVTAGRCALAAPRRRRRRGQLAAPGHRWARHGRGVPRPRRPRACTRRPSGCCWASPTGRASTGRSPANRSASTPPAAWLHAVGHHVRLTGDARLAEALIGPVAKAAHLLRRRLGTRRVRRLDGTPGLYPAGGWPLVAHPWRRLDLSRRAVGPPGSARRRVRAHVADQPEAAAEPRALADELTAALEAEPWPSSVPRCGSGRRLAVRGARHCGRARRHGDRSGGGADRPRPGVGAPPLPMLRPWCAAPCGTRSGSPG